MAPPYIQDRVSRDRYYNISIYRNNPRDLIYVICRVLRTYTLQRVRPYSVKNEVIYTL